MAGETREFAVRGKAFGLALDGIDFAYPVVAPKAAVGEVAAGTLNYGKSLLSLIDFVIIALAIFMAIRAMNSR